MRKVCIRFAQGLHKVCTRSGQGLHKVYECDADRRDAMRGGAGRRDAMRFDVIARRCDAI